MDRADHQPVIAFAVTIVQMNAQNPAAPRRHNGRAGRYLAREKQMTKVQGHPGIGAANLVQRQKRGGKIGHQGKGARLVRFVFDRDIEAGIVIRNFRHRGNRIVPHPPVIALKGIVDPVLTHPQRHQIPAHFGQRVQSAFGLVDGGAAHGGVGVGKGA